jgi:hypothetical protein
MRRERRCPRCGAPAAPGETICLACGRLLRDPRRPPARSRPRWGVVPAGLALGLAVAHLGAAAPRPAPAPAARARPAPAAVVGWQHVLHGTLGPAGAILFPVWLVGPRGRVATLAELDTGNQRSPVVSISLARQVGLPVTGTTPLLGVVPGAQVPAPVYGGATVIPAGPYVRGDPGRLTLPRLLGVSGSIGFAGLLLGQTVLAHTRLVEQAGQWWWAWNGPGGPPTPPAPPAPPPQSGTGWVPITVARFGLRLRLRIPAAWRPVACGPTLQCWEGATGGFMFAWGAGLTMLPPGPWAASGLGPWMQVSPWLPGAAGSLYQAYRWPDPAAPGGYVGGVTWVARVPANGLLTTVVHSVQRITGPGLGPD